MPRHIDAWIDGVPLSSVGPFLIQQVREDAPTMDVPVMDRPGRYGQILTAVRRTELRVTLSVAIRELHSLSVRAAAAEALAKWADGAILEMSNRPERRLRVRCTAFPALGDVRDYTQELSITWTAYFVPYWEDRLDTLLTLDGQSGSGELFIPGTADTYVNVLVSPASGLTSFSVTVAGQTITLTGLSSPTSISLSRDSLDSLAILVNGESSLESRTAESADDLLVSPGLTDVSFSADADCSVLFSVRGRWL